MKYFKIIYGKLSSYFNNILSNKSNQNEIKSKFVPKYSVGDVVYSVMPLSDEALSEIPTTHRVRPFLIVDIDYENGFYKSFAFTSQIKKKKWESALVYYENGNERISCVVLRKLWNLEDKFIKNFVYEMDEKNSIDVVKKVLTSNKSKLLNTEFVKLYKDRVNVEIGDIIEIDNIQYYVYGISGNNISVLHVFDSIDNNDNFKKSRYFYIKGKYIDVSNLENKELDSIKYSFVKLLFSEDILKIERERKEYKSKEKNVRKSKNNINYFEQNKDGENKLVMGTEVVIDDKYCMYLYTDDILGYDYFIDFNSVDDPLDFFVKRKVSDEYEIVGTVSKLEFLEILSKIRPYIKFMADERVKENFSAICRKR